MERENEIYKSERKALPAASNVCDMYGTGNVRRAGAGPEQWAA
jgi:hypothetical protein